MVVRHVPGAGLLAALLSREGESLLRSPDARVLKTNMSREVVALAPLATVLKVHRGRGLVEWLRSVFGASRAQREWRAAHELMRRLVPTPAPLATCDRLGASIYACELLAGTVSLRDLEPPTGRRRAEIAQALGAFVRDLHEQGVLHGDLHPGNIMVRHVSLELFLIDLSKVRFWRRAVPERERVINLADLALAMPRATRADRLRFLRGYLRGESDVRSWGSLISACTRERLHRWAVLKGRRCFRNGSVFRRVAAGAWRGWVRRAAGAGGDVKVDWFGGIAGWWRARRLYREAWQAEVRGEAGPRVAGLLVRWAWGLPREAVVVLEEQEKPK